MRVYLAGPVTGLPKFNSDAFFRAEKKLRKRGYVVFNPARADMRRHGKNFFKHNHTGNAAQAATEFGFSLREALGIDLAWICKTADAIALLPGWENSKGAFAEWATARALGLKIIYLK